MEKILFVCWGNICRSAMAEYVMRDMAQKAGVSVEIDSAGVSDEEWGNPVYPLARKELQKHGISCDGHRARQITRTDFDRFDRIYYMDDSNGRRIRRDYPEVTNYAPFLPDRNVSDPWPYGDFGQTYVDIAEGCARILEELKNG
ncbi:MAG: low molecular weight phosphotyrosine protein phosphatase [Ruminococcaceae bacterium]|nr:low molecular weight phosphotyrosine protein phosphatase [Oscillospiraceae bacterium]